MTKSEYNKLVDAGVLSGHGVYLFRGELIQVPQIGSTEALCIVKASDWLYAHFRSDAQVRIRMPLDVPGESMPDPDAAVIASMPVDPRRHPETADLVVEVTENSIKLERDKLPEYAAAEIQEYWIVDLKARQIEVYREPICDSAMPLGFCYSKHCVVDETGHITPVVNPKNTLSVGDLLS